MFTRNGEKPGVGGGGGRYNEGVENSWQGGANPPTPTPPTPYFMKTRPGSSLKGHYRRQSPGDVLGDVEIIEKHL